jgi:hypothetical protein
MVGIPHSRGLATDDDRVHRKAHRADVAFEPVVQSPRWRPRIGLRRQRPSRTRCRVFVGRPRAWRLPWHANMAAQLGGQVELSGHRELSAAQARPTAASRLLCGLEDNRDAEGRRVLECLHEPWRPCRRSPMTLNPRDRNVLRAPPGAHQPVERTKRRPELHSSCKWQPYK